MIMREHVQIDRPCSSASRSGVPCFPTPSAFSRFALYAFISLAETVTLFSISLRVETRVRRRGYAPEWR